MPVSRTTDSWSGLDAARAWILLSSSYRIVRWPSSRTMLCIQKKEATRAPRVTGVVDDEFAAVIRVRLSQEERCREIGADAEIAAPYGPDRIVDMVSEILAAFIAVEQGWIDLVGEGG